MRIDKLEDYGGTFSPCSDEQIENIHNASMKVFEDVGFKVQNERVLRLLEARGARVNYSDGLVNIDREIVMNLIGRAPFNIKLYGLANGSEIVLGNRSVHFGTGGTALYVYDMHTGERRRAVLEDVANTAKICDELEKLHFFVLPVYPSELAKENVDINRFAAGLLNTGKHVMGGVYAREGAKNVIEMARIIAGGHDELVRRPIVSLIASIISPLTVDSMYADIIVDSAQAGVPIATSTAPIAGATSPVTLGATLVQMNVEALIGVLITQIAQAGAPVLYSAVPTSADMRQITFLFGAIENGLMNAAAVQLARYYNLPIYATGGVTESKTSDIQAGYEKMGGILTAALAGAHYLHNAAGLLESGLTVAYEQYIIDNEICGMVSRVLKGINTDWEHLGLQSISKVGPGGNYLTDEHTLKYMRGELYAPTISNRDNWTSYNNGKSKGAVEKAKEKVNEIMARPQSRDIQRCFERIRTRWTGKLVI